jgi:hypothetical protein
MFNCDVSDTPFDLLLRLMFVCCTHNNLPDVD